MRCLEHVNVDEDVVPRQRGEIRSNVANAAHVRRELIDVFDTFYRATTIREFPQVGNQELIGGAWLKFRLLNVDSADPESFAF